MFEPLTRVTIPNKYVFDIRRMAPAGEALRKIVVIAEVYPSAWANRSVAGIVEQLYQEGGVELVGLGDFDPAEFLSKFQPPERVYHAQQRRERLEQAEQQLLNLRQGSQQDQRLTLVNYLALACPYLQMEAVNDAALLAEPHKERIKCQAGLKELSEGFKAPLGAYARQDEQKIDSERPHFAPEGATLQGFPTEAELLRTLEALGGANAAIEEDFQISFDQEFIVFRFPRAWCSTWRKASGTELPAEIRIPVTSRHLDLIARLDSAQEGLEWEAALADVLAVCQKELQAIDNVPVWAALEALFGDFQGVSLPATNALRLPVFEILNRKLDELEEKWLSKEAIEELSVLRTLKRQLSKLPELLRLAERHGLNLDLYPSLSIVESLSKSERLDQKTVDREAQWLKGQVMDRLARGRIDPYGGLTALFQKEMRRILQVGKDELGLRTSDRPLYRCADHAIGELMLGLARDLEENVPPTFSTGRQLLDLASVFCLDDRFYRNFRSVVGARLRRFSTNQVLAELDKLERDLTSRIIQGELASSQAASANSLQPAADATGKLYKLRLRLSSLEKLVGEGMTAKEAESALRASHTASGLVEELRLLGASFTSEQVRQVSTLDEKCVQPMMKFYGDCRRQAQALANGLMQAMSRNNAKTAVLICGGFHPEDVIRELLFNKNVACTLVTPAIEDRGKQEQTHTPDQLREAVHSGLRNVQIVQMGGGLTGHVRRSLTKKRSGVEVESEDFAALNEGSEAREWIREQSGMALLEEIVAQARGADSEQNLQECRICSRRAPILTSVQRLYCSRELRDNFVLQCPLCPASEGRYLCLKCAGRKSVSYLPGHGRPEYLKSGSRLGVVVCNVHDVPLVARIEAISSRQIPSPSNTRFLGRGLPGHGWFA